MEASAVVTSKGQVTIPARIREALGIRRGARLMFRVEDDHIVIVGSGGFDWSPNSVS